MAHEQRHRRLTQQRIGYATQDPLGQFAVPIGPRDEPIGIESSCFFKDLRPHGHVPLALDIDDRDLDLLVGEEFPGPIKLEPVGAISSMRRNQGSDASSARRPVGVSFQPIRARRRGRGV